MRTTLLCLALLGAAVPGVAQAAPAAATGSGGDLDPRITEIMRQPDYRHAQWGLLQQDPETGRVVHERYPDQFFIPGSNAKLFSVSGAWHTLGGDHRFVTPVYATGERHGETLNGDLVLVAQGDLTMGGRTRADGTVAYTDVDHTYAGTIPGAALTPQDPLAGIEDLAHQVRRSGITRVDGDVIIDHRLFERDESLDPTPTPLIINDNLIDLLTTPGAHPGAPAQLEWRPKVAPYEVTSSVRTVEASGPTDIQVTTSEDGTRIELSGTIAVDAEPELRVSEIGDPNAFGRAALIEALERAGVRVSADPVAAHPSDPLPPSYDDSRRVARHVSPPYTEYAELILKTSHNLGANLAICLMATTTGSTDCDDGFPVLADFLDRAGVDRKAVQLSDGRGGDPVDRATPRSMVQMLTYWLHTPDADRFRTALPILGVDGTLAGFCQECPARGKVFAKTGTVADFDKLNSRLVVPAETVAGYLDKGNGRYDVFFVGVNGATTPSDGFEGLLQVADDVATVSGYLQQSASHRR